MPSSALFSQLSVVILPESGRFTAKHSKRKCLAAKLNECCCSAVVGSAVGGVAGGHSVGGHVIPAS